MRGGNVGCMFIQADRALLRSQQYDDALRQACDGLSANGIKNFIHYTEPCRTVDLYDPARSMSVQIDPMRGGIWLKEIACDGDNMTHGSD